MDKEKEPKSWKISNTTSAITHSSKKSRSWPANISRIIEDNNGSFTHFMQPGFGNIDEDDEGAAAHSSKIGKIVRKLGSSLKGKRQYDNVKNQDEFPTQIPYKTFANTSKVSLFSNNLIFDDKISKLSNVTVLSLTKQRFATGGGLSTLPPSFEKLKNLKELDLRVNPLVTFPEVIFKLVNLSILNLADCSLSGIPQQISMLKNLEELFLDNNIIEMNDTILELSKLRSLVLSNNRIKDISNLHLKSIEILDVGDNDIQKIPQSLFQEGSPLKQLILTGNSIQSLPCEVQRLKCLKRLNISKNLLKKLPYEIGELANLKYLNISWNDITALPQSFEDLHGLEKGSLYCGENPLQRPPAEVAVEGIQSIKSYFKALNKSASFKTRRMKLMILGNEKSGNQFIHLLYTLLCHTS